MRLAALDIGTNSIHMVVADVHPDGSFDIVDREKEMVRLGAGALEGRRLTAEAMAPALNVLSKFKRLIDADRADDVRAVATSAVREAANGGEFLSAVERETGIRVRVISGAAEARLVHLAATYGVDTSAGRAVVLDIGGGSTEITAGDHNGASIVRSLKLGTIRLTERFVVSDPLDRADERRMVRHIRKHIDATIDEVRGEGFSRLIGTSGTVLSIGSIAAAHGGRQVPPSLHHHRISAEEVHRIRRVLVGKTLAQRLRVPGLDPRRADLIVAGAVLLDVCMRRLGAEAITLCEYALREGIILDYAQRHPDRVARADQYADIRRRSVMTLAERCGYHAQHAAHLARLAVSLFDQMRTVHGLSDRAREWLEYAALLHDIGHHISFDAHHRHTDYLIRHGGLRGFDPEEVDIIALIGRYHRRGVPKRRHPQYAALPPSARQVVRVGAAILRLVESLDRSHAQVVESATLEDRGSGVALLVRARDAASLEVWAAERQLGPLEKVLGKRIRLELDGAPHAQHPHHAPPASRQAVRGRRD